MTTGRRGQTQQAGRVLKPRFTGFQPTSAAVKGDQIREAWRTGSLGANTQKVQKAHAFEIKQSFSSGPESRDDESDPKDMTLLKSAPSGVKHGISSSPKAKRKSPSRRRSFSDESAQISVPSVIFTTIDEDESEGAPISTSIRQDETLEPVMQVRLPQKTTTSVPKSSKRSEEENQLHLTQSSDGKLQSPQKSRSAHSPNKRRHSARKLLTEVDKGRLSTEDAGFDHTHVGSHRIDDSTVEKSRIGKPTVRRIKGEVDESQRHRGIEGESEMYLMKTAYGSSQNGILKKKKSERNIRSVSFSTDTVESQKSSITSHDQPIKIATKRGTIDRIQRKESSKNQNDRYKLPPEESLLVSKRLRAHQKRSNLSNALSKLITSKQPGYPRHDGKHGIDPQASNIEARPYRQKEVSNIFAELASKMPYLGTSERGRTSDGKERVDPPARGASSTWGFRGLDRKEPERVSNLPKTTHRQESKRTVYMSPGLSSGQASKHNAFLPVSSPRRGSDTWRTSVDVRERNTATNSRFQSSRLNPTNAHSEREVLTSEYSSAFGQNAQTATIDLTGYVSPANVVDKKGAQRKNNLIDLTECASTTSSNPIDVTNYVPKFQELKSYAVNSIRQHIGNTFLPSSINQTDVPHQKEDLDKHNRSFKHKKNPRQSSSEEVQQVIFVDEIEDGVIFAQRQFIPSGESQGQRVPTTTSKRIPDIISNEETEIVFEQSTGHDHLFPDNQTPSKHKSASTTSHPFHHLIRNFERSKRHVKRQSRDPKDSLSHDIASPRPLKTGRDPTPVLTQKKSAPGRSPLRGVEHRRRSRSPEKKQMNKLKKQAGSKSNMVASNVIVRPLPVRATTGDPLQGKNRDSLSRLQSKRYRIKRIFSEDSDQDSSKSQKERDEFKRDDPKPEQQPQMLQKVVEEPVYEHNKPKKEYKPQNIAHEGKALNLNRKIGDEQQVIEIIDPSDNSTQTGAQSLTSKQREAERENIIRNLTQGGSPKSLWSKENRRNAFQEAGAGFGFEILRSTGSFEGTTSTMSRGGIVGTPEQSMNRYRERQQAEDEVVFLESEGKDGVQGLSFTADLPQPPASPSSPKETKTRLFYPQQFLKRGRKLRKDQHDEKLEDRKSPGCNERNTIIIIDEEAEKYENSFWDDVLPNGAKPYLDGISSTFAKNLGNLWNVEQPDETSHTVYRSIDRRHRKRNPISASSSVEPSLWQDLLVCP